MPYENITVNIGDKTLTAESFNQLMENIELQKIKLDNMADWAYIVANTKIAGTISGVGKFQFNEIHISNGITYDDFNRRFYIEQDGLYRISFCFFGNSGVTCEVSVGLNIDVVPRGSDIFGMYANGAQYQNLATSYITPLSKDDYIVFYNVQGSYYDNDGLFNYITIERIR